MQPVDMYSTGQLSVTDYLPWWGNYRGLLENYTVTLPFRYIRVGSSGVTRGNHSSPNAFSYSVSDVKYLYGTYAGKRKSDGYWWSWTGCLSANKADASPCDKGVTVNPSDLYNRCLSKLNDSTRGSLDISVDLAQASQVGRMFKPAGKIVMLAGLASRKVIPGIKSISQAWLEYRYGWAPLCQTVYDAANESLNLVLNKSSSYRVRSSQAVETGDIQTANMYSVGPIDGRVTRSGRHVCEIGIKLSNPQHDPARWSSLNPVSIAWELVPYSFVVDWFLDVGGYLRNMETALLYSNRFMGGYCTRGTFYDATFEAVAGNAEYTLVARSSSRLRSLNRTLLTSYPVPRLPSFKASLGSGRLLNTAALLGALLK